MLRVTVTTLSELTTVILEGRLAGAWVPELATCWRKLIATRDARSIEINLVRRAWSVCGAPSTRPP